MRQTHGLEVRFEVIEWAREYFGLGRHWMCHLGSAVSAGGLGVAVAFGGSTFTDVWGETTYEWWMLGVAIALGMAGAELSYQGGKRDGEKAPGL